MTKEGVRPVGLVRAAEEGMAAALAPYGFVLWGEEGSRGSHAQFSNGSVLIALTMDWLEGELWVEVAGGGVPVPLDVLVDVSHAKGLSMRCLPKGMSDGALASRLRKIADLLVTQADDVLSASDAGLARLQTLAASGGA